MSASANAPIRADVSYYLLHTGYAQLLVAPDQAVVELPSDHKLSRITIEGTERNCILYYWSEESKQPPIYTGLVKTYFDASFDPEPVQRHSAILFLEVAVPDPYDQQLHNRVIAVAFGSGYHHIASSGIQQGFGKTLLLNVSTADNLELIKRNVPGVRGRSILEQLHSTGNVNDFSQLMDIFHVPQVGARTAGLGDRSALGSDCLRFRSELSLTGLCDDADTLVIAFLANKDRAPELDELEHIRELDEAIEKLTIDQECFRAMRCEITGDFGIGSPPKMDAGQRVVLKRKFSGRSRYEEPIEIEEWTQECLRPKLISASNMFDEFQSIHFEVQELDQASMNWVMVRSRTLMQHVSYVGDPHAATAAEPVPYRNIVSEGRYLRCPATLHDRLLQRLSSVSFSTSALPPFDRSVDRNDQNQMSEGAYNKRVANAVALKLMDESGLRPLFAGSRVEFCDLFDAGRMYCVKRTTESDAVAKVCQQAMDAAATLDQYPDKWQEVHDKADLAFDKNPTEDRKAFTFILALIATQDKHSLQALGLKSRLAINRARAEIVQRGFGFAVEFITDPGGIA